MPKQIADEIVFNAALKTIIAKGYAGATTRAIAEAANINEVTLFRKFGSKAELVAAAISYEVAGNKEAALKYSGDVVQDLGNVVQAYISTSEYHSRLFPLIMSEMSRYPELRQTMAGPLRFIGQIGQLLARYQREGRLISEDPMMSVQILLGPVIVHSMLKRADPDIHLSDLDLQFHIETFVKGRTPD